MDIKKIGEEVLHDIETPFVWLGKAEHVLAAAIKEQPEVKGAVQELVKLCDTIGADTMIDVAERGLNIVDDLATVKAISELGVFLKDTFVPLIRKVYGELEAA